MDLSLLAAQLLETMTCCLKRISESSFVYVLRKGEDQLAWIPSCLMWQAVLEKSFGAMLLGSATLLRDGLLPSKMPDDEGARHWIALYQALPNLFHKGSHASRADGQLVLGFLVC